jgi:photosystem II stability/assembly factor-like uncharacterized protein
VGGLPTRGKVTGFAVDPADARRLYAAGPDGVFVSTDGGERWSAAAVGSAPAAAVAVSPARRGEVYAVTEGGGVYRSIDSGRRWTRQR